MQINLNPTSERGASRDAVNRPRETLGDSHLISSDPRSRFGLVCDLLCCRGNTANQCISPGKLASSEASVFAAHLLTNIICQLQHLSVTTVSLATATMRRDHGHA